MIKTRYPITIEGEMTDIGTAAELVVALNVLQGHHDRQVLEQLKDHITEILLTPEDLYNVLTVLIPEDQVFLIEIIGSNLVHVLKKASWMRDILATLADLSVEAKLIENLGSNGLQELIHSAEDLSGILEWVYEECDKLVLELLGKDFLMKIFQSGYELSLVLYSLDHIRQNELIEMLGWENIVKLIRNRNDLAHLFRALPSELSKKILTHFTKEKLWKIIIDEQGWHSLRNYLETDEITHLKKILGVK